MTKHDLRPATPDELRAALLNGRIERGPAGFQFIQSAPLPPEPKPWLRKRKRWR